MARGVRPETFHGLVALALTLVLTITLLFLFRLQVSLEALLVCWFLAVNVTAFGYYGYDKMKAKAGGRRVPEMVLHGIALAGGPLGAYLGMRVFRHKTIKGSFQFQFWVIAVLEGLLVIVVIYRLWKMRG